MSEHAANITHDGLRRHRTVGDDLRDTVTAVLLRNILDDPVAAIHAKIHVEVGHRDAFGIQEALEQEVILQRIDVGDAEAVGHQRAGTGAAARTDGHAVLARPPDEVGDDEEVAGEAHLTDHIEFLLQALAIVGHLRFGHDGEAFFQAIRGFDANEVFRGDTARHRVRRQAGFAQFQHQAATASDLHRIDERLGHVREQHSHFLRRAQVLLL